MGLSGYITGLAAGSWQVGLRGYSGDFANWNNNEFGNNTALVYRPNYRDWSSRQRRAREVTSKQRVTSKGSGLALKREA